MEKVSLQWELNRNKVFENKSEYKILFLGLPRKFDWNELTHFHWELKLKLIFNNVMKNNMFKYLISIWNQMIVWVINRSWSAIENVKICISSWKVRSSIEYLTFFRLIYLLKLRTSCRSYKDDIGYSIISSYNSDRRKLLAIAAKKVFPESSGLYYESLCT